MRETVSFSHHQTVSFSHPRGFSWSERNGKSTNQWAMLPWFYTFLYVSKSNRVFVKVKYKISSKIMKRTKTSSTFNDSVSLSYLPDHSLVFLRLLRIKSVSFKIRVKILVWSNGNCYYVRPLCVCVFKCNKINCRTHKSHFILASSACGWALLSTTLHVVWIFWCSVCTRLFVCLSPPA